LFFEINSNDIFPFAIMASIIDNRCFDRLLVSTLDINVRINLAPWRIYFWRYQLEIRDLHFASESILSPINELSLYFLYLLINICDFLIDLGSLFLFIFDLLFIFFLSLPHIFSYFIKLSNLILNMLNLSIKFFFDLLNLECYSLGDPSLSIQLILLCNSFLLLFQLSLLSSQVFSFCHLFFLDFIEMEIKSYDKIASNFTFLFKTHTDFPAIIMMHLFDQTSAISQFIIISCATIIHFV